jgi:hypothetical protein
MSERRIVQAMSSLLMGEEEICRGISSGRNGEPVSKPTLSQYFENELANGRAMLKARAAGKFYAALDNNAPWAIQAAMRNQSATEEQPESRQKRSHKSPNSTVGTNNPPVRAGKSVKNSHTSPRRVHRQKRMAEALGYREQGYSFDQIAAHMKVSRSTAHGYVVQALREITLEPAREVLTMELRRLDAYLSAFHANAVEGDLPAAAMALNIIEKRAKLLGLYPETGRVNVLVAQQHSNDAPPLQIVEFVVPGRKPDEEDEQQSPVRGPQPPWAWQKQLPKPVDVPMFRDPLTGAWRSGPTE